MHLQIQELTLFSKKTLRGFESFENVAKIKALFYLNSKAPEKYL